MWDFLLYMAVYMHKSSASYLMTWALFCMYVYLRLRVYVFFASLICLLDGQSQRRTNFAHQINGAAHQKGQNHSFNRFIWAIANFTQNDKSRAFVLGKYLILFIIHIQIRWYCLSVSLSDMRALLMMVSILNF